MASKFGSPGVFSSEIDQSFIEQGVAGVGAAVIGRTPAGPAFLPMTLPQFNPWSQVFGGLDVTLQTPYAVRNYLKNSQAATTVRVLGSADGTGTTNGYTGIGITAIVDSTGSTPNVLAVIHHSGSPGNPQVQVSGVAGDANNFVVKIGGNFAVTASFVTSSANYITKVLNTDPTKFATYNHYLYQNFKWQAPAASASWQVSSVNTVTGSFTQDYAGGQTPWITSQPLGGNVYELFRFWTIGDGRATNDQIKVTIANVKPSPNPTSTPYGSFDVVVRDFYDTDLRPRTLDIYTNCNLDPNSPNFILRRIGDMYEQFSTVQRKFVAFGSYQSKSKYIRVEMQTSAVAGTAPAEALPFGFRGFNNKLKWTNNGMVAAPTQPDLPLRPNMLDPNGTWNSNIAFGVDFGSGSIVDRMRALPATLGSNTGSDSDFSLGYLSASWDASGRQVHTYAVAAGITSWQPVYLSGTVQKFTLPFFGGFDGWDLRVADPLYLNYTDTASTIGVVSLKRAVDCIANPDAVDYDILAIPGIHNQVVTDYARTMVNTRKDAIDVLDLTGSSVDEVVNNVQARQVDDNYAACYYPDLKLKDTTNGDRIVRVAPSVAVIGAYAFNDRVAQPWFAPAGLNRGGLAQFDIVDVVDRLDFNDRSKLYDNRINPIATFPNEGIVVWGQKTLQVAASALDRVNVRRLLIYAKKVIGHAAKLLVFEPNDPDTWQRFQNAVNPILSRVAQNHGVQRFKVVMNSDTNTPDVVDRNIMVGKIFLQPTKAAEFIDLQFIITNAGVQFAA